MTITIDNLIGMTKHTLTLQVPIPQNGQTHKNNSLANCRKHIRRKIAIWHSNCRTHERFLAQAISGINNEKNPIKTQTPYYLLIHVTVK